MEQKLSYKHDFTIEHHHQTWKKSHVKAIFIEKKSNQSGIRSHWLPHQRKALKKTPAPTNSASF
jgi:aerobic-type carbon monoxide dehydrogenase small subunit (CoxS/CutS family)